jgi:hypothetical protein
MCYKITVDTASRSLCGLVCPSRTSERGGQGDCVNEEGGEEGERETRAFIGGATTRQPSILRLIPKALNAAALAAASPALLFIFW